MLSEPVHYHSNADVRICTVLCALLLFPLPLNMIAIFTGRELAALILRGVVLLLIAMAIPAIISRLNTTIVMWWSVIGRILVISLLASTQMSTVPIGILVEFATGGLPLLVTAMTIRNTNTLWLFLRVTSIIACVINIVNTFSGAYSESLNVSNDQMGLAYSFLPFVCVLVWWALSSSRYWVVIAALLATVGLVGMGTRGPVIILMIYVSVALWVR